MGAKETSKCKRCNKPTSTTDFICQECKNELLTHFEATSDWQTAYEIERAQLTASRFRTDDNEEFDFDYY